MTRPIPSAGPITRRPWWRLALGAVGRMLVVVLVVTVPAQRYLPAPWGNSVPLAFGLAVAFSYFPGWWAAEHWRATALRVGALTAFALLVVGVSHRLGW